MPQMVSLLHPAIGSIVNQSKLQVQAGYKYWIVVGPDPRETHLSLFRVQISESYLCVDDLRDFQLSNSSRSDSKAAFIACTDA